jgi:hypothetical protein
MRVPVVSQRGAPRRHECPATACTIWIPMHRLACSDHWFSLPEQLRSEINRTYRKDRRAHLAAYREAVCLLTRNATQGAQL